MAGKLTFKEIKEILNLSTEINKQYRNIDFDTFIETGTHIGSTTFEIAPYFKEIHTIELSKEFYDYCVSESLKRGINNIEFYHGSSDLVLFDIINKVKKPSIFFLDSHWSQDNTARGDIDVPLLKELEVIRKRNLPDILFIDDQRLFGTHNENDVNWAEITEKNILNVLKGHIYATISLNDRFVVFLKTNS